MIQDSFPSARSRAFVVRAHPGGGYGTRATAADGWPVVLGHRTEFVVSGGALKLHVKHILIKLNATSCAQAVPRYLRVAAAQRPGF